MRARGHSHFRRAWPEVGALARGDRGKGCKRLDVRGDSGLVLRRGRTNLRPAGSSVRPASRDNAPIPRPPRPPPTAATSSRARGTIPEHGREGGASFSARVNLVVCHGLRAHRHLITCPWRRARPTAGHGCPAPFRARPTPCQPTPTPSPSKPGPDHPTRRQWRSRSRQRTREELFGAAHVSAEGNREPVADPASASVGRHPARAATESIRRLWLSQMPLAACNRITSSVGVWCLAPAIPCAEHVKVRRRPRSIGVSVLSDSPLHEKPPVGRS